MAQCSPSFSIESISHVAHGGAATRPEQEVRGQAHAFLTTSDHDSVVAVADGLISQMHGFQATTADLVDVQAGHFDG